MKRVYFLVVIIAIGVLGIRYSSFAQKLKHEDLNKKMDSLKKANPKYTNVDESLLIRKYYADKRNKRIEAVKKQSFKEQKVPKPPQKKQGYSVSDTGGKNIFTAALDAQSDYEVLVELYNALDGPNWMYGQNENWLTGPINTWKGVTVDANNNVIALDLNIFFEDNRSAKYLLPTSIGTLGNLTSLSVITEQNLGQIPSTISSLSKLEYLTLKGVSGTFPDIFNLTNLVSLEMESGQIEGGLSEEIGNLVNLEFLRLYNLQLDGGVPSTLVNLTKLEYFTLSFNNFDSLPSNICSFPFYYIGFCSNNLDLI